MAKKLLSVDQAVEIVRGAFAPLHCGVEATRYGETVRFRVFDTDDEGVLKWEAIPAGTARDPQELKDIIRLSRERLTAKGFKLDPWAFPKV